MSEIARTTSEQSDQLAAALEAVEVLQRRVDALEAVAPAQAPTEPRTAATTRRALLTSAGVAAGAGALSLFKASPAAAANGDPLLAGAGVTATTTTSVEKTVSGGIAFAVYGTSGMGLFSSVNGTGAIAVAGQTDVGRGAQGVASGAGIGVLGSATAAGGIGGSFQGGDVALRLDGNGRLRQGLSGSTGAPQSGTAVKGDTLRDNNGDVYVCTVSGSPGTWERLARVTSGYAGGALHLLPKPVRVKDTRTGQAAFSVGGGPYAKDTETAVTVSGLTFDGVTIPAGVTGVLGNITVVGPVGSGFVTVFPFGATKPGTSNVNYVKSQVVANSFISGVGSNQIKVFVGASATHVIVDIAAFIA
jgi:hypothetical protein